MSVTVRVFVRSFDTVARRREPITVGVPFPKGQLRQATELRLADEAGHHLPLQARTLDRWSDGSARWVLCDWQADTRGESAYTLYAEVARPPLPFVGSVVTDLSDNAVRVNTGVAQFTMQEGQTFPFAAVTDGPETLLDAKASGLIVEEAGTPPVPCTTTLDLLAVEEKGALRACVRATGRLLRPDGSTLAPYTARLHFFAGSAVVRLHFTLHDPRPAGHPGGLWDLGGSGSIYLRQLALRIALPPSPNDTELFCSTEPEHGFEVCTGRIEVYQDSSGGDNWRSHNHLNRKREVPLTFRGYRFDGGRDHVLGARSTPVVVMRRGAARLSATMPTFWQNFPKGMTADDAGLTVQLFPPQFADDHELQGGEQKTHVVYLGFGPDGVTEAPLEWSRAPLVACVEPDWVAKSEAVRYLTPSRDDPFPKYVALVEAAIDGRDTFERKREVIDEYGWRHFGDIYGDHEAVFHQGEAPLVSHYNNQYDAVGGLGAQFLRSGEPRWFRAMAELASHVIDIDIYQTDGDKAAYNRGLFWHTYHYVDADTGTHRSYPKAGRVPPKMGPVPGGGPANEQNYAAGLMLHYFLTGEVASRDAAVGLARWVIHMDDGRKTVFRWLAWGATGLASSSRSPDYHGPGRGPANSISALIDGFRLTGDVMLQKKAEELIRRCVHPDDDVTALVAIKREGRVEIDAENRWFYTMFLQSLGKYLDDKVERGQLDGSYAYARASLLHYARWMADCEYPYLDRPELLEYPTETWAAQDMRKAEVFQYALLHAQGDERALYARKASEFFRASVEGLAKLPTRTLCRPVVLLLSLGWSHAWWASHPDASAPAPTVAANFGRKRRFVPQKRRAIGRAKALLVLGVLVVVAGVAFLVLR